MDASSASLHILLIIRRVVLAFMHFIRHMMAFTTFKFENDGI